MGGYEAKMQRPAQIKRLQLLRNERIELKTPGPSAQKAALSSSDLSCTGTAQDELISSVFNQPVNFIHEIRYFLNLIDHHRFGKLSFQNLSQGTGPLTQRKEKIIVQQIDPAGFWELLAQQGCFPGLPGPPQKGRAICGWIDLLNSFHQFCVRHAKYI